MYFALMLFSLAWTASFFAGSCYLSFALMSSSLVWTAYLFSGN